MWKRIRKVNKRYKVNETYKKQVMYNNYLNFLNQGVEDITKLNFKSNMNYRGILEHISKEYGEEYIKLIETEFPLIEMENILEFIESK